MTSDNFYNLGVGITGLLIFAGVWLYSMEEWGLLTAIMFGWIPALIAAVIGGILWPFLVMLLILLVVIAST